MSTEREHSNLGEQIDTPPYGWTDDAWLDLKAVLAQARDEPYDWSDDLDGPITADVFSLGTRRHIGLYDRVADAWLLGLFLGLAVLPWVLVAVGVVWAVSR